MIFSRIVRSLSRPSRSTFHKSVISGNYGVPSVLSNEPHSHLSKAGLEFVRGYLSLVGAGRQIVSNTYRKDFNSVLVNHGFRRLFCSKTPKRKNYENYYPKDKKEIPKGKNKKSEAKGVTSSCGCLWGPGGASFVFSQPRRALAGTSEGLGCSD